MAGRMAGSIKFQAEKLQKKEGGRFLMKSSALDIGACELLTEVIFRRSLAGAVCYARH